ncbi:MAG: hypothetical protein ACP6IY_08665 [Promethearchaeia archaeon]
MSDKQNQAGVKCIIICSKDGVPLVTVKVEEKINEALIAPFFSALDSFTGDNIDALSESLIKTGNLDILVKKKHGLILIAILDKKLKKIGIGSEAEQALDLFYEMYKEEIDLMNKRATLDLNIFKKFEVLLNK